MSELMEEAAVWWGSPSVITFHVGSKDLRSIKPMDLIFDLKTDIHRAS